MTRLEMDKLMLVEVSRSLQRAAQFLNRQTRMRPFDGERCQGSSGEDLGRSSLNRERIISECRVFVG